MRAADLFIERVRPADVGSVTEFLREADLTLSGLDEPSVRLWVARDATGRIVGSTGHELNRSGDAALVRSVAVHPAHRGAGRGTALARVALDRAAAEGATAAWLFSRRSGPFWQGLGFASADCAELAAVFADTHQVRMFQETGRISIEVAWTRTLV